MLLSETKTPTLRKKIPTTSVFLFHMLSRYVEVGTVDLTEIGRELDPAGSPDGKGEASDAISRG